MIKNTSDFNKEKIKKLEEKFTLKDAMKFRSNIRFYKQDNIPSKEVIEEIIQDAHDLIPHKNNMIECNIKVYGPEFAKEKEDLVLSTMCGTAKEFWRKGGQHEHDYDLLKRYMKIGDLKMQQQLTMKVMSIIIGILDGLNIIS